MTNTIDLPGRWDLYGPVHKGLRRAHALLTLRLGNADFTGDVADLLADLRTHLAVCAAHLADEERFLHEALEQRVPGTLVRIERQHDHHRETLAVLADAIAEVEAGHRPAQAGRDLYHAFTRFVAEDLVHMLEEEREIWPILCAHFSDAELIEIEGRIVGSLPPAMAQAFMATMIPAVNLPERIVLLRGARAGAPPEAYADLFAHLVRPQATPEELARLEACGLAA